MCDPSYLKKTIGSNSLTSQESKIYWFQFEKIQNQRIVSFNYFKSFLRLVVFMGKEKEKPPSFFNL
jgi:hypothetical protein